MFYVYILTNSNNTVLYTGVTNHLARRILEHKSEKIRGFTSRYNIHKLVYYEYTDSVTDAIAREKQIKKYYKRYKKRMITKFNPYWLDLTDRIL